MSWPAVRPGSTLESPRSTTPVLGVRMVATGGIGQRYLVPGTATTGIK
ncbi:MAG: hypothetical protein J2P15_05945 [Micromonosporaceae bacterium]|nr:hypothetical protein [Micromonosporaceae bacterium]